MCCGGTTGVSMMMSQFLPTMKEVLAQQLQVVQIVLYSLVLVNGGGSYADNSGTTSGFSIQMMANDSNLPTDGTIITLVPAT